MIAGVGLPVNLELEAVTMGFAFKTNFILPENASDFYTILSDPFYVRHHPITSFKRSVEDEHGNQNGFDTDQNETFERHQVRAQVMESGTEAHFNSDDYESSEFGSKFASTRWLVYKGLAEIAEK